MEYKNKRKENEWLNLLEQAINEGIKIKVSHKFKYKNKSLGTFLSLAKQKNRAQLIKKIESLGFNFKMHSKDPEHFLEKFILDLSKEKEPNKQKYMTRFNVYVMPKKDILKEQTIKELNELWLKKFGEARKWEKADTEIDKVRLWKEFRYDKKKNPEEKWFDYRRNMGKLYGWVYTRKRDNQKMSLITKHFNKKELSELKKEGF